MAKTLDSIDVLKSFGIKKDMTTHQYVQWLETKKGEIFLETISSSNRNLGDYWTMHEAKSKVITNYSNYKGK